MRNALPNAGFIGFTGTPLIAGEEKTKEVFGDYVSVYNYASSTADGATVPLYSRTASRPSSSPIRTSMRPDGHGRACRPRAGPGAEAGPVLGQQYELITREDRLDRVGKDIVSHFLGRGFQGKAMVVSIDKATAVRTYLKFQAAWEARLKRNEERLASGKLTHDDRDLLEREIAFMR